MNQLSVMIHKTTSRMGNLTTTRLFTLLLLGAFNISAQSDYAVNTIDKSLLKSANAVIREDDTHVLINKDDDYIIKRKKVITVLNSSEEGLLDFQAYFKKGSSRLKNIDIKYYDSSGIRIKQVGEKNLEENAGGDGYSIITDYKTLSYNYHTDTYPITVSFEYEYHTNNTYIPDWSPFIGTNISIEASQIKIENRAGLTIYSKEYGLPYNGIEKISDYCYKAESIKAINNEMYVPYANYPRVEFDSKEIVYEGHKGEISGWSDLGRWIKRELLRNDNLDNLKIDDPILNNIPVQGNKLEIAKALYNNLQKNTRYISISLKDGGLKPMDASLVNEVKYGDCKALTFYMQALLKRFDIASNYVVVEANSSKKVSFDEHHYNLAQGNHIILRIPMEKDTFWLDCTSSHAPFGFLGSFTDDRRVLAITEEGGELVMTPEYDENWNQEKSNAVVSFEENNGMTIAITKKRKGIGYLRDYAYSLEKFDVIKEYVTEQVLDGLKSVAVDTVVYNFNEELIESEMSIKASAKSFFEQMGDYLLVPIAIMDLDIPKLKKDSKRENDIEFQRSYYREAVIEYDLPEDYNLLIDSSLYMQLESEYGSYTFAQSKNSNNRLEVKRSFLLKKGRYSADKYSDIKLFFDKAIKNEKLLLNFERKRT